MYSVGRRHFEVDLDIDLYHSPFTQKLRASGTYGDVTVTRIGRLVWMTLPKTKTVTQRVLDYMGLTYI